MDSGDDPPSRGQYWTPIGGQCSKPFDTQPKAFKIAEVEKVDQKLISVMMPFAAQFNVVYAAIKEAIEGLGLTCKRGDDLWVHDDIIQDVVTLIDESRIVVCDCTGKNANVFYEMGIAHTLGKSVIMLAQSKEDIPFDVGHKRYLGYLNNNEGLEAMKKGLAERIETLMG